MPTPGAETPPSQTRNCCGRRVAKAKRGEEEEGEVVALWSSSQLEAKDFGGSATSMVESSSAGEVQGASSMGSLQSTASSSAALPDPLSPGLVPLLAPSFDLVSSAALSIFLSFGDFLSTSLLLLLSSLHFSNYSCHHWPRPVPLSALSVV